MGGDVPAVVGGRLPDIVRHQRHLIRPDRLDQFDEAGIGIALDIEFAAGKLFRKSSRSSGTSERRI